MGPFACFIYAHAHDVHYTLTRRRELRAFLSFRVHSRNRSHGGEDFVTLSLSLSLYYDRDGRTDT